MDSMFKQATSEPVEDLDQFDMPQHRQPAQCVTPADTFADGMAEHEPTRAGSPAKAGEFANSKQRNVGSTSDC